MLNKFFDVANEALYAIWQTPIVARLMLKPAPPERKERKPTEQGCVSVVFLGSGAVLALPDIPGERALCSHGVVEARGATPEEARKAAWKKVVNEELADLLAT